jgi:hypothetical protein
MHIPYRIVDWPEAKALTSEVDSHFIKTIEYNNGSVYQLTDGAYVILPVNPFAKCLCTPSKNLLDEWITTSCYPTNEAFNSFYFLNKEKIESISRTKAELIRELAACTNIELNYLREAHRINDVYWALKKNDYLINTNLILSF